MAEYIEREALIAELNDIAKEYLLDGHTSTILAAGVVTDIKDNVVREQPTADVVEVRHGEFVYNGKWDMVCSICGFSWFDCCQECGVWPSKANYCPNCGAKMDGGNNG